MYFEPRETVMDREQAIQRLFDGINQNYKNWHGKGDNYHKTHLNMELSPGRKFDKVIENESGEPGRGRVWGFIAKVMVSTREYLTKRVMSSRLLVGELQQNMLGVLSMIRNRLGFIGQVRGIYSGKFG